MTPFRFAQFAARQLGNPSPIVGPLAAHLWNRRNAALNKTVLELLDLKPADRVLEIGFGGGYLLGRMAQSFTGGFLAGVDVSQSMVAAARRRNRKWIRTGRLTLEHGKADSIPYPDGHFNKACCVNTIFYWQELLPGLAELHRVLTWGGTLVTCFTSLESIENKRFAGFIHLYEDWEVEADLVKAGFQAIQSAHFSDRHRQYTCLVAVK